MGWFSRNDYHPPHPEVVRASELANKRVRRVHELRNSGADSDKIEQAQQEADKALRNVERTVNHHRR